MNETETQGIDEVVNEDAAPDLFSGKTPGLPKFKIPMPETGKGRAFAIVAGVIAALLFLPLSSRLSGIARIEAENSLDVESLVSGELREIYIKEGALVKKGDPLVLIYDRMTELDLTREQDQKAILEKRLKIASDRTEFLRRKVEKNEKLFDTLLAASQFLLTREIDESSPEYFEYIIVLRILNHLGYISPNPIIDSFIKDAKNKNSRYDNRPKI